MSQYLSQVTTKPVLKPPRIGVYGPDKSGKTTFGASAPKPVILPFEEGGGILNVPTLPQPESYEDGMNTLVELVTQKHDFGSLIVDTLDHLEPLLWQKIAAENGKDSIDKIGFYKGYMMCTPLWINWFKALDQLRNQGMTIIVLCHSETKTVDDVMVGSFMRSQPRLHKLARELFCEWADVIGFLQIERMARNIGEDGKRQTRTSRATSQRILYLEDQGGFSAGNRYGLPTSLLIPKENGYEVLRAELLKALGVGTKPKAKKEAA